MRGQIDAHRRELEVRLAELHDHAERAARELTAEPVAREQTAAPVGLPPSGECDPHAGARGDPASAGPGRNDPAPGEPGRNEPSEPLAGELAALRAELEQARDAAREQAGRNVEATGALVDLHRAVSDLRDELSELERRRATVEAQTHTLQRQLGERTEEATRAGEQARVLAHGLERVREDERDRAGALRQAEVSLSRLRDSAVDLGAGLEREREAHTQVAAALRRELQEQRRTHEATAEQARGQASTLAAAQGAGIHQAVAIVRDVGTQLCERLRGLERSVDGLGDGLRGSVGRLDVSDRHPVAQATPDELAAPSGRLIVQEHGATGLERTAELERTARELIGTARQLRGAYEHKLGSIQRELEARLEHEREAHARELEAVQGRVDRLRHELGQTDRVLRAELAAEHRARSDAEQQLAAERERARARERVRLELERALEVERERAAEDRKAAVELSRALAQRVGSERRAHQELDRLRAELAREPRDDPSGSVAPARGVPEGANPFDGLSSQAADPPVGDDPAAPGPAEALDPPVGDDPAAPGSAEALDPPGGDDPVGEGTGQAPGSPEPPTSRADASAGPATPPPGDRAGGQARSCLGGPSAGVKAGARFPAGPPDASGPTGGLERGEPRRSLDTGARSDTLAQSGCSTPRPSGAQAVSGRQGDQLNGAWNGEITAARLGDALRGSVGSGPLTPPPVVSREPGAAASTASEREGSPPGGEMADALTRAVQRLRDRADAAQAAPRRGPTGGLRRPGGPPGATGSPGSAPASWPASLRPPSWLDALRGRPGCAAAPAQTGRCGPLPVIPHAVALSLPSTTAPGQTSSHPWLAGAIRRLAAGGDPALAGALLAELLPAQGLRCRRRLDFEIDIEGTGAFLVAADGRGRATVLARSPAAEAPSGLRLCGTAWQLAELVAGGSGRELPGVQVQGRRRVLRRLLRSRQLPVSLAELAAAGVCPWPGLLLVALAQAVPAVWTQGEDFTVGVAILPDADADADADADPDADAGADADADGDAQGAGRSHPGPGQAAEDADRARSVVLAPAASERSLHVRVRANRGLEVGDGPLCREPAATLHVRERELLNLLGAVGPGGRAQALVTGDPQFVYRLLAWFHRAQGLAA